MVIEKASLVSFAQLAINNCCQSASVLLNRCAMMALLNEWI